MSLPYLFDVAAGIYTFILACKLFDYEEKLEKNKKQRVNFYNITLLYKFNKV